MGPEGKPGWIRDAVVHKDRERLSAAGRKGARVRHEKQQLEADRRDVERMAQEERRLAEDTAMREQANEHIAPID